jgi:integrase
MKCQGIKPREVAEKTGMSLKRINSILNGNNTNGAIDICAQIGIKIEEAFEPVGKAKNLSNQTILHYYRIISTLLTTAVYWKYIKENPAKLVKAPKVEDREARSLGMLEIEQMLDLLEGEPIKYKAIIYTALCTGCRLGEITALTWDCIDFKTGEINIYKSAQYIPGIGVFIKGTKNSSSRRVLAAPSGLLSVLEEYKVWQDGEKSKLGDLWHTQYDKITNEEIQYVFTQMEGKQIFPNTPSTWFHKFSKRHGLPNLKFHELRHTHASAMIDIGIDLQTVSKRMGHSKVTTTTKIYSHKFRPKDTAAAESFNEKILRCMHQDEMEKE